MLAPSIRPLALSDSQITAIMAACRPLSTDDRDAFLQHVAAALAREREIGDGVVARVVREAFKQRWRPPELDGRGNNHGGKYAR
jgi:hypothetical protein